MPAENACASLPRVALACDHGGYVLKVYLLAELAQAGYTTIDCGCASATQSVDYPDYAAAGCASLHAGEADLLVLVCGTGIGMSIAANKIAGTRCARVCCELDAELAREHNNANAMAIGERTCGQLLALRTVLKFLSTPFAGGRHAARVDKITALDARTSADTLC